MPSERVQRQIDLLLDEAEQAIRQSDWTLVHARCEQVLALDPGNGDARAYSAAAQRATGQAAGSGQQATDGAVSHQPSVISSPSATPDAESVGARLIAPAPEQAGGGAQATRPTPDTSAHGEPVEPQPPLSATPASFVNGRYTVRRFLGEGGKKQVYLAHDELLDRDVAFALIKTEGLDETGRARIKREAQAMGRLGSHPHIVSVFDMGEEPGQAAGSGQQATEVGARLIAPAPEQGTGSQGAARPTPDTRYPTPPTQPYIVTELMAGGDVEGLIEHAPERRLPLDRTLEIGIAVCKGLEFAHAHDIVHRDLKPGNVWLTGAVGSGQSAAVGEGTAKLGDFGLAVALARARLTQAGMMVGTVSYMPPEQAMGGEVTPKSDLYSLGAMLYEMVTGRPPFVGDESVAIITQHLNIAPVAPSWHNLSIPSGLEALILRLLEKDPAKRPGSAAEVGAMLSGIAASLGTGAMNRAPTLATNLSRNSLSLAGEGRGEGEAPGGVGGPASSANPLYRRAFVGRENELRQLQAAFDAATSGQGSLVMVVGEPGIGKTALCEQLATYAIVRGGRTLVGHCYEEGSLSLPYLPFVEAMRSYVLAREPEALKRDLGSGAPDVARIVSEIRDRLPEMDSRFGGARHAVPSAPSTPADPEEERYRLFQAVTVFLRNAATVQPLVIILEDLHDADRGTLELLLHLSRNLAGRRLLLAGTYRDIEVDRAHPLSATLAELRRGANFSRVLLRGLTADEVERLLSSIGGQEVSWRLAEAVHRQTEGNPLFVQEVLRYLVEEGRLSRHSPGSELGEGSPLFPLPGLGEGQGEGRRRASDETPLELGIPEGLRDVIGKRLSHLSQDCNQVLSVAAVIGRDFGLQTLRQVATVEEEPLLASLEEAVRVGVLEDRSQRGLVRFRFTHAFFRQTLYEELFTPRRLRLHQQVARALEQQYASRLEEHAAELAEHFAQSSDPADLARAVQYSELAAQRAISVYAYGEAARHLEQALQAQEVLDPDDQAQRCDLLSRLGEALIPAGEPRRVVDEVAPAALSAAEALKDDARAARVAGIGMNAVVASAGGGGSYLERKQWAEVADRYAAPDTPMRVRAELALASLPQDLGRPAESRARYARVLELARRVADPEMLFAAAAANAVQGLALADEFTTRSREGVTTRTVAFLLDSCARTYLSWGRRERAEEVWEEVLELASRAHDPLNTLRPYVIAAVLATIDGRLDDALESATQLRVRGREAGVIESGEQNANFLALGPLLLLGRGEEARVGWGTPPLMGQGASGELDIAARQVLWLVSTGRHKEAREVLDPFLTRLRGDTKGEELGVRALVCLLEAAVLLRDQDLAGLVAPQLSRSRSFIVTAGFPTVVARHLGAASALLGDREAARRYYDQALEVAGKVHFRPEIALTHLQLAELLLGQAAGNGQQATGQGGP